MICCGVVAVSWLLSFWLFVWIKVLCLTGGVRCGDCCLVDCNDLRGCVCGWLCVLVGFALLVFLLLPVVACGLLVWCGVLFVDGCVLLIVVINSVGHYVSLLFFVLFLIICCGVVIVTCW